MKTEYFNEIVDQLTEGACTEYEIIDILAEYRDACIEEYKRKLKEAFEKVYDQVDQDFTLMEIQELIDTTEI